MLSSHLSLIPLLFSSIKKKFEKNLTWKRESGWLVRIKPNTSKPTISELENEPWVLKDLCYSVGSAQSSYIWLPQIDANFEIKPQIINMLPKFTRIEDAYIFMRKFEEVCTMMWLQQLTEDVVKLRLINFTLKDSTKSDYTVFLTNP